MYSYVSSSLTSVYVSYHCCFDLFIQQQLSLSSSPSRPNRWEWSDYCLHSSTIISNRLVIHRNGISTSLGRRRRKKIRNFSFFTLYLFWKNLLTHVFLSFLLLSIAVFTPFSLLHIAETKNNNLILHFTRLNKE